MVAAAEVAARSFYLHPVPVQPTPVPPTPVPPTATPIPPTATPKPLVYLQFLYFYLATKNDPLPVNGVDFDPPAGYSV